MPNSELDTNQKLTQIMYEKNLDLLYEQRRVEQLLYSVSESVIAIDLNYHITTFNRIAEAMTGLKKEEALGKSIEEVVKILDKDGKELTIKDFCFDTTKTTANNLILKGYFRNYYVNLKSVVVDRQDGSKECLITISDVTREKELEKTKDDFLSVASHELRTPMTIIKSYLWMLDNNKAGELNPKQKGYLSKAVISTERMINLINDMLNISRLEQGRLSFKIEQFDVVKATKEALIGFELKAAENHISFAIYNEYPMEDKLEVWGDIGKVKEIIINLVGNSMKFTKQGGITVKFIKVPEAKAIRVEVVDTGAGLNGEDLKKLFLKFGRLDNSYTTVAESGGTGLGLYICKIYAEAMHGKIGALSAGIKKGSTFWFTLPTEKPADLSDSDIDLLSTSVVNNSQPTTDKQRSLAQTSITSLVATN